MENRKWLAKGALTKALMERDFSAMTISEIARDLGTTETSIRNAVYHLWNDRGIQVHYLDGRKARRVRRMQEAALDGR